MSIERSMYYFIMGILFAFVVSLATAADANGSHDHNLTIINNYSDPLDTQSDDVTVTSIVDDVSVGNLTAGVATAIAAGGHQLDYSTTDLQGSVNMAYQASGDNENNVSFALGKRWKSIDALFHMSYTPDTTNDDDWFTVGGTFRF